ncbi:hypothetical protein SAMN05216535_2571 [Stutzerimonas xanthomarina]|uniref:Uncharacterized protein n=2 Tax=Stutzerimonas xanthomarina TaxID=271420 RepID=A0A1M5ME99_9GAMM|nr:hypothetical protein SAMN05216535_2571 [Stutzerimonas xanthomarina]SHG75615.1 hypothetical protein SAMN02744645_1246 [Stutzerimonas xanthomarina DSM 18231]
MSIDPLDRPHNQQPVPGQQQNPSHSTEPDFITDNPDVQPGAGNSTRPAERPRRAPEADPNEPGLGNPLP